MFNTQIVRNSTAIRVISHNPESNQLRVIFSSGQGYTYDNVSPQEFNALRNAPSVGSLFNRSFRGREFNRLDSNVVSRLTVQLLGESNDNTVVTQ